MHKLAHARSRNQITTTKEEKKKYAMFFPSSSIQMLCCWCWLMASSNTHMCLVILVSSIGIRSMLWMKINTENTIGNEENINKRQRHGIPN